MDVITEPFWRAPFVSLSNGFSFQLTTATDTSASPAHVGVELRSRLLDPPVGRLEGSIDGKSDGMTVGNREGSPVGSGVGAPEGMAEGSGAGAESMQAHVRTVSGKTKDVPRELGAPEAIAAWTSKPPKVVSSC
jgi:hypothetical protein